MVGFGHFSPPLQAFWHSWQGCVATDSHSSQRRPGSSGQNSSHLTSQQYFFTFSMPQINWQVRFVQQHSPSALGALVGRTAIGRSASGQRRTLPPRPPGPRTRKARASEIDRSFSCLFSPSVVPPSSSSRRIESYRYRIWFSYVSISKSGLEIELCPHFEGVDGVVVDRNVSLRRRVDAVEGRENVVRHDLGVRIEIPVHAEGLSVARPRPTVAAVVALGKPSSIST